MKVAQWERSGRMGERGEGSKKLQNIHRNIKYSIGNIVNNIVKTMYGASRY